MFTNLIIATITFILFSNAAYADELKLSLSPSCNQNKVICPSQNEVPTCISLRPNMHIEKIQNINGEDLNKYQPSCGGIENNSLPGCVESSNQEEKFDRNTSIECIELVKCNIEKTSNKLMAECSDGKMPKCLGSSSIPNCENETICDDGSIPVCDYIWQASK